MEYRINDLVRIKEQDYKRITNEVLWNENVFHILSTNGLTVKLSDIHTDVPIEAIEPIPIDGVSDASIYYDPIIAADIVPPEQPFPTRKKNTSYYVDGFATIHIDGHTLKDEFLSKDFRYVHEVQRWLVEEFGRDELRVNQSLKG